MFLQIASHSAAAALVVQSLNQITLHQTAALLLQIALPLAVAEAGSAPEIQISHLAAEAVRFQKVHHFVEVALLP